MMSQSGEFMIADVTQEVQEDRPVSSMSADETLSAITSETSLVDSRCGAFQAPSNSSGASQFTDDETRIWTLQSHISPPEATHLNTMEEKPRTSEQFVTMSEVVQALSNVCSMKFNASESSTSSPGTTQLTGREERTRISGKPATRSEGNEALENFCPLEDWNSVYSRRSPLPLWYPRRPLQDITAVLNNCPVPLEEATRFKKGSKKAMTLRVHGRLYDNRGGAFSQQRAPKVPSKSITCLPSSPKRSSLLRKGFR